MFNLPHIDQISFWIGFIVSSILWILLAFARPLFNQIIWKLKSKRDEAKARTISLVEEHYLNNIYTQIQGMHLAASLFSLKEISIAPRLLAPPPRVSPDEIEFSEDLISDIVPYLPTWPEIAATFKAPTLSFSQALSGKSDLVITGQPGTGKSFSLAYLAAKLAQRADEPGLPKNTIPFLIHIADLNIQSNNRDDPLVCIIDYVSSFSSTNDLPRIPQFVKNSFKNGPVLLLLDGTDELSPDNLSEPIKFIKTIKQIYPLTQIITTGMPDNFGDLVTLNFIPFTLACWETSDYASFLNNWGTLWSQYVKTETWIQSGSAQVDPLLINTWIGYVNNNLSPLEITLLTWGLYAGDVTGGKVLDSIKAHVVRLTPLDTPPEALELLALQTFISADSTFDPRKARDWIKSFEPNEPPSPAERSDVSIQQTASEKSTGRKKTIVQPTPSLGLISTFVESGLLITHRNNRMSFIHPVIGGFLAGKALGNLTAEKIINLPNWCGKYLGMNFYAALGDAETLVLKIIETTDHPLERNTLMVARWLRDAPMEAKWRVPLMERLVGLFQLPSQPLGLRGQVLAAILKSGDSGVPILLRHMLEENDPELIQLCALGIASLKDTKSTSDLAGLLNHISPNVRRTACLALATIGTSAALDPIASVLLHSDEDSRKAAAEALATHPDEGYAMLQEGATMEDILVRRAVAYGLGCIDQFWATELLTKLQLEDDQWIVRNAANEVLEKRLHQNKRIPQRLLPPSQCPWLIAFAGRQGIGISANSQATDVLLLALSNGKETEQLAALDYLRATPSSNVIASLYKVMYGNNSILREASYRAIWELAARGVLIPDPKQFGVS
jgi:HEAT repeat protein